MKWLLLFFAVVAWMLSLILIGHSLGTSHAVMRLLEAGQRVVAREEALDERESDLVRREMEVSLAPPLSEAIKQFLAEEEIDEGVRVTVEPPSGPDEVTRIYIESADETIGGWKSVVVPGEDPAPSLPPTWEEPTPATKEGI